MSREYLGGRTEAAKRYRLKNKGKISAYNKEWAAKNRDKANERRKRWALKNPEKSRSLNETQDAKPKNKYKLQMRAAARRGIEWLFTFETWWEVWEYSGRWEQRGRGASEYCMCRKLDKGAYSPDNVYIATSGYNRQQQGIYRKPKA